MRIAYETWKPGDDAIRMVHRAEEICADYQQQGYDLTLRQLYYQFVARGLIPNNQKSYNRLGEVVNRARMAGFLDWDYIEDRTRNLVKRSHWNGPDDLIDSAARSFGMDLWHDQPTRVEVWVEKEALAGVIGGAARRIDCAWFSCRGYVSQSEMWAAGQRLGSYIENGQSVVILHLGDHDPSGIDMTRDIRERITTFVVRDYLNRHKGDFDGETIKVTDIWAAMTERCGGRDPFSVDRIALNMDQIEQYDPPPNPAKMSDSRAGDYVARFGDESWELDALDPATLDALITDEIEYLVDAERYEAAQAAQETHRELLTAASDRWDEVADILGSEHEAD